ncbi:MAG: NAD(P)/FAD-dependent oxidoreductase [Woeseiaceae bacterium]|jgi:phytoene dehydrogenase-like protein|nr:NAD(P)/FAD-dependent oxidoreductase [Woeseiaceae bacterium]
MTERYDAIIVGGGHNGLVAAAMLARAGRRVLLLERSAALGGASITREFADGFAVSAGAQWLGQLQPAVVRKLGIETPLAARDVDTVVLAPGDAPVRYGRGRVSGVGDGDTKRYAEYAKRMRRYSKLLWAWLNRVPPRLGSGAGTDTRRLLRMALELRLLGRDDMREFLRLIGMNVYDDVEECFESRLLKGGLCLDAVLGTHAGPRSPNTFMTSLYRYGGEAAGTALPAGGMSAVSNLIAKAARDAGAELVTGAPVSRILVENGRVTGVETEDGERHESYTVLSSVDPKQTVLSLIGARHFEAGFVRRVGHLRAVGTAAKLHLALDGLPTAGGMSADDLGQRLLIAPDPDSVERAFNPAKYRRFSPAPVMDISIPSVHDETLAPAGKHVLSAIVQYAPCDLEGGWTDASKKEFLDICLDRLAEYLPGIRDCVIEGELLTPADLEREFGMTGGHWHHGELSLDQFLFTRPLPGCQQYRAPLDGLYFCGAGAHPGGGVTGVPGYNAARVVIERDTHRS